MIIVKIVCHKLGCKQLAALSCTHSNHHTHTHTHTHRKHSLLETLKKLHFKPSLSRNSIQELVLAYSLVCSSSSWLCFSVSHTPTLTHAHIRTCTHACTHMHIHTHTQIVTCRHACTYTHTHTAKDKFTCYNSTTFYMSPPPQKKLLINS